MHQIVNLAIAGSNPVGHPLPNSFAEHALRVLSGGRQRGLDALAKSYRHYFRTRTTPVNRLRPRLPKSRHYRPKDLAVVRFDGRDVDVAKNGSDESRENYRRVADPRHPATVGVISRSTT